MKKEIPDVYENARHASTPISAPVLTVKLAEVERLRAVVARIKSKAVLARAGK